MKISNLGYLILHKLEGGEKTGYDIHKDTGVHYQQVYREANKLVGLGLVLVEDIAQADKPDKRVFSLSEKAEAIGLPLLIPDSHTGVSNARLSKEIGDKWLAELIEDALTSNERLSDYQRCHLEADLKFLRMS